MFFIISKILDVFAQPLNILILIFCIGTICRYFGRLKIARNIFAGAVLFLFIGGFTQFPDLALAILERQVSTASMEEIGEKPAGIIILGGSMTGKKQVKLRDYHLNDGAERVSEGLILARKFPSALLIFTGGIGALYNSGENEADTFELFLRRFNVTNNEIVLERNAKNTWQNAVKTIALLKQRFEKPDELNWLMVTSAFHMPRALGSFRKAGLNVLAWPVDYRADVLRFPWLTAKSAAQFSKLNTVVHELIGTAVYQITGRI